MDKNGTTNGVTGNAFGVCPKTVHVDDPRARKLRLDLSSRGETYGVICPSSASTSQRSVLARPLFEVEQLLDGLMGVDQVAQGVRNVLLTLRGKARNLKFMFEGYPGRTFMLEAAPSRVPLLAPSRVIATDPRPGPLTSGLHRGYQRKPFSYLGGGYPGLSGV